MSDLLGRIPLDPNHLPIMAGVSDVDLRTITPIEVDPATGAMHVTLGSSSTNSRLYTGQVTVALTQVQVLNASHTLNNGIIIKAPSSNTYNVFVGLTGVTTANGDIIEPGEARGYAVSNTNLLYIISASSTTDIISYSGN